MKTYTCRKPIASSSHEGNKGGKNEPAKRLNIVSVKMAREASLLYNKRYIESPDDAYPLFRQFIGDVDRECFIVLCLDAKNQPTHLNIAHTGTLNASLVHPREVLKPAILANACSVIVAHNHPSNDPTPSQEDLEITKRLVEAGKTIGIHVLDHLIICEESYVSLKERGDV